MLNVLLLLGAFYLIHAIAKILEVIGIIFVSVAVLKKDVHRRLRAIVGIACLIPTCVLHYLQNSTTVNSALQRPKFHRSCRRDSETDMPSAPITAHGVRLLTSHHVVGYMHEGLLSNAATNPLYYLGTTDGPRFAFVERNGQRYIRTPIGYTVEPMGESRAEYAIDLSFSTHHGISRFQWTVSHQPSGKRIASLSGFQHAGSICPEASELRAFLDRTLVPTHVASAIAPPRRDERVRAYVFDVDPERHAPSQWRIDLLTGPPRACPSLRLGREVIGKSVLDFDVERSTRRVHLLDPFTHRPLEIHDIACRENEALVLTRAHRFSTAAIYALYRFNAEGELLGRYELVGESEALIDSTPSESYPHQNLRELRWSGNRVEFVVRILKLNHDGMPGIWMVPIHRVAADLPDVD